MSIKLLIRIEPNLGTAEKAIVADTAFDFLLLQELVQRGSNLWPDAPPQIKKIADIVTSGKIMQNYGPDALPSANPLENLL